MNYREQIEEIISANGWDGQFIVEVIAGSGQGSGETVRVRLRNPHPNEPAGMVNDYVEGVHPLEQVQQECLRALRTGRVGI